MRYETTVQSYISWTDASGLSRVIAAVCRLLVDGVWRWFWTRMSLPEDLWDLSLLRNDKSIGIQELLAVLLMAETFANLVKDNTWTTWCDNQGVVSSLIKGQTEPQTLTWPLLSSGCGSPNWK